MGGGDLYCTPLLIEYHMHLSKFYKMQVLMSIKNVIALYPNSISETIKPNSLKSLRVNNVNFVHLFG